MITYTHGCNILLSSAQTIVNTVNCVGVMGKGLALSVAKRWPGCLSAYQAACHRHELHPGMLMTYRRPDRSGSLILHFPTKELWRNPSQLEWIELGLIKFCVTYTQRGITSVAFPPLGCGNGGLSWDDVGPLMAKYLDPLSIQCCIYLPVGAQEYHASE